MNMLEYDCLGKKYTLSIRTVPFSALDDLWVEARLGDYISFLNLPNVTERLMRKARQLAVFELVAGGAHITREVIEASAVDPYAKIRAIGALPYQVINKALTEYWKQFEEYSDPKV